MFEAMVGDLTQVQADAIVNAANGIGPMGGGVAAALRRAAGREVEEEAIARCKKEGPFAPGSVYVTGAGHLKARFLLHAVTMTYPAQPSSVEIVERCLHRLVEVAQQMQLRRVALPFLATGVGGVRYEESAPRYPQILGPAQTLFVLAHPHKELLQRLGLLKPNDG